MVYVTNRVLKGKIQSVWMNLTQSSDSNYVISSDQCPTGNKVDIRYVFSKKKKSQNIVRWIKKIFKTGSQRCHGGYVHFLYSQTSFLKVFHRYVRLSSNCH